MKPSILRLEIELEPMATNSPQDVAAAIRAMPGAKLIKYEIVNRRTATKRKGKR